MFVMNINSEIGYLVSVKISENAYERREQIVWTGWLRYSLQQYLLPVPPTDERYRCGEAMRDDRKYVLFLNIETRARHLF